MKKPLRHLALVAMLGVLSGCTGPDAAEAPESPAPPSLTAQSPVSTSDLQDPAVQQEDDTEDSYLSAPVIHERGTGPSTFDLPADLATGSSKLRVFITCSPGSDYTVDIGKSFSSACNAAGGTSGIIPVPTGQKTVTVTVDEDAQFWVLVVPVAE